MRPLDIIYTVYNTKVETSKHSRDETVMELSAPFLVAYWPYLASILVGFLITQIITRFYQPKKLSYTVDVDPLQDSDLTAIPSNDPANFSVVGEREPDHMPYPWFGDRLSEDEMKKKSAEFFEKMDRRRTVRKISEEDIPLEVVENIIKTAGKRKHPVVKKKREKNQFLPK